MFSTHLDTVPPFEENVGHRMEGDTFEMEDQRNWTGASYKTYVRPLALPWPYTLAAGAKIDQAVTKMFKQYPPSGK